MSWNDAALRNESVDRLALVMPSKSWLYLAGCLPSRDKASLASTAAQLADDVASDEFGVAGVFDLDTAEHLANDDFEVLVGDVLALRRRKSSGSRS